MVADWRENYDQARALYEESIVLARDVDDGWLLSAATNNLGGVYMMEGDYERAIELFEESLAIGEARGDLDRRARELTAIGHATRRLGDLVRAHEFFRSGLVAAEEIGLVQIELSAISGIVACLAESGQAATAARLLSSVNEQFVRLGAPNDDVDDAALEESLRERLGPELFGAELAAGAALGREATIDLALGRSDPAPPG
jgi:tetratricopeptide (TPR) repeat protein